MNQYQINLIAFETIVKKEILRFMRIWMQTVLPPAITTGLYFIIFGELIGSQLPDIEHHSYLDYIIPGIILMSVLTNAYSNVVSSFYGTKFHRNIEELLIAPVPNAVILTGYVVGGVCRGLIVGLVVTFISAWFTDFHIHDYLVTICIVILTAVLFSLAGFINAIYAKSFDDISIIPTFILTPLTYLGGIFYSVELLPEFWQQVSLFNPILYMVNAFRYGMLGISDISLVSAFGITLIFIGLLTTIALSLLNRGIGIKQ
jgi:ABC-2 type transport system permease protein